MQNLSQCSSAGENCEAIVRITTKAIFDMETMHLIEWEGYDYDGPIEHCGGGPSNTQKQGAQQTLQNAQQEGQLARQSGQKFNNLYGSVEPFYSQEQDRGLPFYNNLTDFSGGSTAQAFAPAKADFLRRSSTMGALPSGFKAAGMNDINEAQGHAFDDELVRNMMAQYQTRQAGAAGKAGLMQIVNPAAFYGGSSSAGSSVMQPLQPGYNPWMGVVGGAAQGAASAIPF
jgi:hypothetical protein